MKEKKDIAVGVISVAIFLHLSGFVPNLTGGFYQQLNTNNAGLYYDAYFIHRTDVVAAEWLRDRITPSDYIQASIYGALKVLTLGNIYASNSIIPAAVRKDSYVFLDYTNVKKLTIVNIEQNIFQVTSSNVFLNDKKNLIYNNGAAEVFK